MHRTQHEGSSLCSSDEKLTLHGNIKKVKHDVCGWGVGITLHHLSLSPAQTPSMPVGLREMFY